MNMSWFPITILHIIQLLEFSCSGLHQYSNHLSSLYKVWFLWLLFDVDTSSQSSNFPHFPIPSSPDYPKTPHNRVTSQYPALHMQILNHQLTRESHEFLLALWLYMRWSREGFHHRRKYHQFCNWLVSCTLIWFSHTETSDFDHLRVLRTADRVCWCLCSCCESYFWPYKFLFWIWITSHCDCIL